MPLINDSGSSSGLQLFYSPFQYYNIELYNSQGFWVKELTIGENSVFDSIANNSLIVT